MKKKNQPDNIRHLQDYRKTLPGPPAPSRPLDASYGHAREPAGKPSKQVKKGKSPERKRESQIPKVGEDQKQPKRISSSEKRGRPLQQERKRPMGKKKEAGALDLRAAASPGRSKKGTPPKKASPPVLVRRRDKYRWVTVLLMGILICICASVVGVIGRNAEISKIRLEISNLEKQAAEERNKVKELKMKLETSNRTDYIEERARKELGMDYIRDDQIVYIDVE